VFTRGAALFAVHLIRRRPNLVHLNTAGKTGSFSRNALLALMSRLAGVPVILHVHSTTFDMFYRNAPRVVRSLIRATLNRVDAVLALAEVGAGELHAISPDATIVVVPTPVQLARKSEEPHSSEQSDVMVLGLIGDRGDTDVLIDAWAQLGEHSATLTIARPARPSDDEVSQMLDRSQVLVLPSRHDGQPMAVLEAMARGMCIVASDVGSLPELIGDGCGLLVPPGDAKALAEALRLAIGHPDARAGLGAAAYQRAAERFDVGIIWPRLDALYRELSVSRRKRTHRADARRRRDEHCN
jgi:glycosyltransferase involved in cell wall biosynthesis